MGNLAALCDDGSLRPSPGTTGGLGTTREYNSCISCVHHFVLHVMGTQCKQCYVEHSVLHIYGRVLINAFCAQHCGNMHLP